MPREQTYDDMQAAIASHEPVQEPYHLEPPSNGSKEDDKERAWSRLVDDCTEFAQLYGFDAMLRCVSETLHGVKK